MKVYLKMAFEPHIVRRSLRYSLIVGTILIIINHGNSLLNHQITGTCILKMSLTALVPYIVSTCSSIESLLKTRRTKS